MKECFRGVFLLVIPACHFDPAADFNEFVTGCFICNTNIAIKSQINCLRCIIF